MNLIKSILLSSSALSAQSERMKVISENMANADSTSQTPGGDPYRRKIVSFKDKLDRSLGIEKVVVGRTLHDKSDFQLRYDPGNPGADSTGYVKLPNVNMLIEMADMREAQRSYEANLSAIDAAKSMTMRTIDLLRS